MLASRGNYRRHLEPIGRVLEARGHDVAWLASARARPRAHSLVLAASWYDARRWRDHRTVYVEHGAGQTYLGRDEAYAGGSGLDHVVCFIGPGEHVSARWRAVYPSRLAVSVGCPALDVHLRERAGQTHIAPGARDSRDESTTTARRTVVVTCHWRCSVCPETLPAVDLFSAALHGLRTACNVEVVGSSHPRDARRYERFWRGLGVPFMADPDDVIRTADLLVADNSSLLYEAAACGVPVLALNRPSYRRDVEHGLRFWSHVPGLSCDDPADLHRAIDRALGDPPTARALRALAVQFTYAHRDGASSERAADAIEEVL